MFLLKVRCELPYITRNCIAMVESIFAKKHYRVLKIRPNNSGENIPAYLLFFLHLNSIYLQPSPALVPESTCMAERFVLELCTKDYVLQLSTDLPILFLIEGKTHGNGIRNILSASKIHDKMSTNLCNPNFRMK